MYGYHKSPWKNYIKMIINSYFEFLTTIDIFDIKSQHETIADRMNLCWKMGRPWWKIFFKLVKLWRKVTTKLDLVNWRVLSKNPKAFYSLALTFLLKIFGPCGHKTYYCKCSQQVLILPIIILTFELIFIFVILYTNWRTCNFCKSSSFIYRWIWNITLLFQINY